MIRHLGEAAVVAGLAFVLALDTGSVGSLAGPDTPAAPVGTLTHVGQAAPAFEVTGLDGRPVRSASLRGKVAVIVFWATWCPPCRFEMPRLEKEIWEANRQAGLAFLAIAREESVATVQAYRAGNHYTMPMAADPSRSAYERFAGEGIPRTYVLSPGGEILFQSVGYDEGDFAAMKTLVARELRRLEPPSPAPGRAR